MSEDKKKEAEWYIKRINYYDSLRKSADNLNCNLRLYSDGEIEAYTDLNGADRMYNFWLESLIWHMEEEIKKNIKSEKNKLLKKLQEKEDTIRELAEIMRTR